jgi:hypothetical protein
MAFSCPKEAERAQQYADPKLECIFGNARKWSMHNNAHASDQQTCRKRTRTCGKEQPAPGAERYHDEHYFKSFEKHGFEAG